MNEVTDREPLVTGSGMPFVPKAWYPDFNWDKVPVYMMFGDDERLLTDAEVRKISGESDFICIEKQHGKQTLGGAEKGLAHETAAFKAVKPGIKVIGYFNAAYAYPFTTHTWMFTADTIDQHPGKKAYLMVDPGTGELARRGTTYFFDALNPEFRAWWSDTVARIVEESGADGIFIDQMHGFAWLRRDKQDAVEAGVADMLARLKKKMGPEKMLLANNGAHLEHIFPIADAFMLEHYSPALTTKEALLEDWRLLEKISDAGKVSVYRFGAEADPGSPMEKHDRQDRIKNKVPEWARLSKQQLPYYLAVYLIGAQPYSYFQWGWGWNLTTGPLEDYPELQRPLGKPLGAYARVHPDKWEFTREFEHLRVWVDSEKREAKLDWK